MQPIDYAQREQALDVTRSFIVQAPAGSGKTSLLTRRYLKLLAAVAEPEEIVALTFTRKAAAEMRHRVLRNLSEDSDDEVVRAALDRDRDRSWKLLQQPSRLRIMTIDAL